MDDESILKGLLKKDENVLIYVIEEYQKLMWVIVENILGSTGTAQDIEECVSDVFIRLWKKPNAFNPKRGSLKVFLCVMARSMALNTYKSLTKKRTLAIDQFSLSNDKDIAELIYNKDLVQALYNEIAKMKEPDKEILIRRFFYNEMPSQIAKTILIDVKEVENRLYQGKKKLKNKLKACFME